jgi:hypothetical protein
MYKNNKNLLLGCLLIISVFSSIFGWVQYLLYPNLKFLKILGWDEHLYRLSGTFLDPNFMGLIIVFGIFVALKNISKRKNIFILVLLLFLVISLFFTYSRSSYLAFIGGVFFLYKRINLIKYFAFLGFFILFLTILPRKGGEGVRLERISSVVNRIDYAKKSLPFVYKYPLFGLGFNNMCFERLRDNIDNIKVNSKACSGVDSSLYLIIITTGLIGTILIFDLTRYLLISSIDIRYLNLFNAIAFSLLIHSLFVNSLFYSWTLGYFAVISGTLMKLNNRRKP